MSRRHSEQHRSDRIGWLRAAVLGANDGIVSTASLIVGVAAAGATHSSLLVTGLAGLVAGAMSMAAGEYVSVHSQADTEQADLSRERGELQNDSASEHRKLAAIYVARGLTPALARDVAEQLMAHDALGAHARDELGISATLGARPFQAAMASAASFAVGAALPLIVTAWVPGAGCRADRLGRGDCDRLSRGAGRGLGPGRRREPRARRVAGHVLGHARDGNHRGRGQDVRRGRIAANAHRIGLRSWIVVRRFSFRRAAFNARPASIDSRSRAGRA